MPNHNEAGRVNHAKKDSINNQREISESRTDEEPPAKKRCVRNTPDPYANGTSSPVPSQTPIRIKFTKPRATTQDSIDGPGHDTKPKADTRDRANATKRGAQQVAAEHSRPENERADKRVLRSQDGGARGASELASFFPEFYDVVYGPEIEPGKNAQSFW